MAFTDVSTGLVDSIAWTFPGGDPATSDAATPSVSYAAPGTYDVTLVAFNSGGSDDTVAIGHVFVSPCDTVADTMSSGLESFASGVHVVPNPFRERLILTAPSPIEAVALIDVAGRRADVPVSAARRVEITSGHFAPGFYVLEVRATDGSIARRRVVAR